MIFMMPMPPTISETEAIDPSSSVITWPVCRYNWGLRTMP